MHVIKYFWIILTNVLKAKNVQQPIDKYKYRFWSSQYLDKDVYTQDGLVHLFLL